MKTTKLSDTEYYSGTRIDLNAISIPSTPQVIYNGITRMKLALRLEARMRVYDTLHGTNYTKLRHAVVARDRNAEFEKSIGLVRSK